MASYQFIKNGEAVSLSKIDEEICNDFNKPVDPDKYCQEYDIVIEIGFAVLMSQGGSYVTEASYKRWRANTTLDPKFFEQLDLTLKKYLYGKYKFSAWR